MFRRRFSSSSSKGRFLLDVESERDEEQEGGADVSTRDRDLERVEEGLRRGAVGLFDTV